MFCCVLGTNHITVYSRGNDVLPRLFKRLLTLNPLCAIFFSENINIYLHSMPFLHTNTVPDTHKFPLDARIRIASHAHIHIASHAGKCAHVRAFASHARNARIHIACVEMHAYARAFASHARKCTHMRAFASHARKYAHYDTKHA